METGVSTINQNNGLVFNSDPEAIKEFRKALQNFTTLLNKAPKKEKLQTHQGYQYLPISFVEKELDKLFFGAVQYECISYTQIFNEIACHARLKVFHPVLLQWMVYDGLGSAVIQQNANTLVIDFQMNKKPNALQLALPKAYAEAIKNAAKKIGKIFGSDINRKFEDVYEPMIKDKTPEKVHDERVKQVIDDCQTLQELMDIKKDVPESMQSYFTERFAAIGGGSND